MIKLRYKKIEEKLLTPFKRKILLGDPDDPVDEGNSLSVFEEEVNSLTDHASAEEEETKEEETEETE